MALENLRYGLKSPCLSVYTRVEILAHVFSRDSKGSEVLAPKPQNHPAFLFAVAFRSCLSVQISIMPPCCLRRFFPPVSAAADGATLSEEDRGGR